MLPKNISLKKEKDFENVLKSKNGRKEDFLYLKTAENGLKISRFGFIISKKVFKSAVIRNKIKRILREIIKVKLADIKKTLKIFIKKAIKLRQIYSSRIPRITF